MKLPEDFWMHSFGVLVGIEWLAMRVLLYLALLKFIFLFF